MTLAMALPAGGPADVLQMMRRRRRFALMIPALILTYLAYSAWAFDIAGLAGRLRPDNAAILLGDFWSHKVHVGQDNRSGAVTVAIEGESRGTYETGTAPDWVTLGTPTVIDLGDGHLVTYGDKQAFYDIPGYGRIDTALVDGKVILQTPDGQVPDFINAAPNKVTVTTDHGRFSFSRSKIETFRYFPGWELFFFTLDSPFHGKSLGELIRLATVAPRLDPAMSNIAAMGDGFWNNKMWHHRDVAWALVETLLMAFLGTLCAALLAVPLSLLAASNIMPIRALRFATRRLFDFVRGMDALIWTVILARAFGPGPMTGALAILITDAGIFGKTFSEAIENIDEKQVEGVGSTGANPIQRARFGILPQVAPVILSQVLYSLESNTRSATIIGAIVGGGIGLMLTQAIATQKDWEEVAYYLTLIVLMVMVMDSVSGWLRRKLIKGE